MFQASDFTFTPPASGELAPEIGIPTIFRVEGFVKVFAGFGTRHDFFLLHPVVLAGGLHRQPRCFTRTTLDFGSLFFLVLFALLAFGLFIISTATTGKSMDGFSICTRKKVGRSAHATQQ